MTKIVMEPTYRLLYVVTSQGDVMLMSLTTGSLIYVVKDSNWTVSDIAVDKQDRLYNILMFNCVFIKSKILAFISCLHFYFLHHSVI